MVNLKTLIFASLIALSFSICMNRLLFLPYSYFFSFAALIFLQIFAFKSNKTQQIFVLITVSILLRSIFYIRYDYAPKLDIAHFYTTKAIIRDGYVTNSDPVCYGEMPYSYYPLPYIFGAIVHLISSVSSETLFFLPILSGVISTLFIYLITKSLTCNTNTSYLAAIIFTNLSTVIRWTQIYVSTNFAVFFLILLIYILTKSGRKLSYQVLTTLASVGIILSHHATGFLMMSSLLFSGIASIFVLKSKEYLKYALTSSMLLVSWWVFMSSWIVPTLYGIVEAWITWYWPSYPASLFPSFVSIIPELMWLNIGRFGILFSISGAGVFYILYITLFKNAKQQLQKWLPLFALFFISSVIPLLMLIFGKWGGLDIERWILYASIPATIIFAYTVNLVDKRRRKIITLSFMLIFIVVTPIFLQTFKTPDFNLYSPEYIPHYSEGEAVPYFTSTEIKAVSWIGAYVRTSERVFTAMSGTWIVPILTDKWLPLQSARFYPLFINSSVSIETLKGGQSPHLFIPAGAQSSYPEIEILESLDNEDLLHKVFDNGYDRFYFSWGS